MTNRELAELVWRHRLHETCPRWATYIGDLLNRGWVPPTREAAP